MFNVTKAWVVLNCSELSPNIFRKRRNVSCAHYDFFPEQLLLSYVRFPFQRNSIFFFFFAPKNCFQTLLTNPISELEMFFKNAVVDKFWFLGKIALTEISFGALEQILKNVFKIFFVNCSFLSFCFVFFRFVSFLLIFHFSETPKKNFFCGAHRRPETKTETETEAANYWNQNLLLCPQQKNQRREGGGEGREKSACECVCV